MFTLFSRKKPFIRKEDYQVFYQARSEFIVAKEAIANMYVAEKAQDILYYVDKATIHDSEEIHAITDALIASTAAIHSSSEENIKAMQESAGQLQGSHSKAWQCVADKMINMTWGLWTAGFVLKGICFLSLVPSGGTSSVIGGVGLALNTVGTVLFALGHLISYCSQQKALPKAVTACAEKMAMTNNGHDNAKEKNQFKLQCAS